jgi:uncharacterized protein
MSGETNLKTLLTHMQPVLHSGEYVFCCIEEGEIPAGIHPLGTFREEEGLTVIVTRAEAESNGWPVDFVAAWITLQIHSDLAAVGLTAAVSTALAAAGISCNVVAAYTHDHLFIPYQKAEEAVRILKNLSLKSQEQ